MNFKTIISVAAAGGLALLATAADPDVAGAEKGELEEAEFPVSVEAGISFDSKYMTYGVVDGKDPIVTPGAKATFFDWAYVGVESIFDVTKGNGRRGGYGNRAGRWTTLDAIVGLAHDFDLGDTLGALSVDVNYIYEYLRRYHSDMGDTQYVNLELSLGDLWFEPALALERDLMADEGTYVNFSIGHTFPLVDGGEGEDPVLAFRPSVGQGFGDRHRNRGYELAEDHGGLMDTEIRGELTWKVCDHVSLSGYVAYADYVFDRTLRHGARKYNGGWGGSDGHSWNFWSGLALVVEF